jgi:porphobilinogen synthase
MPTLATFPLNRSRRLRTTPPIRDLVQESHLHPSDLIYPVFIQSGQESPTPILSMPGQTRLTLDALLFTAERCLSLGISALALFPFIDPSLKTTQGEEALNPEGLIPRAIALVKKQYPQLILIADIALDPYTSHGQDGLIDSNGIILNDETVKVLAQQAICLAQAGADIVAPSDMMDGRVLAIRQALETAGYPHTLILAYSAKYASSLYGPFREAVGSQAALGLADKKTYQINPPNGQEALREVAQDVAEGADMVMVKPGSFYLDIVHRIRNFVDVPVMAYQVSGEYAMIKAAAQNGWLDHDSVMLESLIAFKRAGACAIFTYFALEAAQSLRSRG